MPILRAYDGMSSSIGRAVVGHNDGMILQRSVRDSRVRSYSLHAKCTALPVDIAC